MTASVKPHVDLGLFFSDLKKYAALSEVSFNPEAVETTLDVLSDVWEDAIIAVRTTDRPRDKRTVQFRYMAPDKPHNPFERLRGARLLKLTGRPVEKVIPEVMSRFSFWWALDATVAHGIEKFWLFFEPNVPFDEFMSLRSIPDSVQSYRNHFRRFVSNDSVALIGLDFTNNSLNIYPEYFRPGTYPIRKVKELFLDLGFPVPSEEELRYAVQAFCFYHTFRWDKPDVQRLSFAIPLPREALPIKQYPALRPFIEHAPFQTDRRMFLLSPTYGRAGKYMKIDTDYTGTVDQIVRRGLL